MDIKRGSLRIKAFGREVLSLQLYSAAMSCTLKLLVHPNSSVVVHLPTIRQENCHVKKMKLGKSDKKFESSERRFKIFLLFHTVFKLNKIIYITLHCIHMIYNINRTFLQLLKTIGKRGWAI